MEKKKPTLIDALGAPTDRHEILEALKQSPDVWDVFSGFPPEKQEEFLDFMMGNRGLNILYNVFFKSVFNPEIYKDRLEALLSALLGKKVIIREVLPKEGIQLSEKGSFVVMDILVELEDGTIFNLEIQKVGYLFPGQRTSCYISDLIMRQYNKLHALSDKNHPFNYNKMKPVHILVLMQDSSAEFKAVAPHYMHRREVKYTSGVKVTDLENVTYVSLDTFHDVVQNNIDSDLHAWLTFLCNDDPEAILKLITRYPSFIPIYRDIAMFRKHPKEVAYMYSEALREMDRNTELFMVSEARKQLEILTKETETLIKEKEALAEVAVALTKEIEVLAEETDNLTKERDAATKERDAATKERDAAAKERDAAAKERDAAAKERDAAAKERDAAAKERDAIQSENQALKSLLESHHIPYPGN